LSAAFLRNDPTVGDQIRSRLHRRLKRKAASRHDIWHLDEVVISINGERRFLWRAVDQEGSVLDEIVQIHRNTNGREEIADKAFCTSKGVHRSGS
jgi:transposase-like protein